MAKTRVLMCQPDFLRIDIEINEWMDKAHPPHPKRARQQWQRVMREYDKLGVELWFIEAEQESQDMCFTANAGWCRWGKVVLSNFVSPKVAKARRHEPYHYERWFGKYRAPLLGVEIVQFPLVDVSFEGQGDVVTVGRGKSNSVVLVGYGQGRTDYRAVEALRQIHNFQKDQVVGIRLVNPKFYHLDTACLYIPPSTFLYYPDAFDIAGKRIIEGLGMNLLTVDEEDANRFVCNGVFIEQEDKTTILMNSPSQKLDDQLQARGYRVVSVDTSEFIKSGGSVRCLTLFLPEEK